MAYQKLIVPLLAILAGIIIGRIVYDRWSQKRAAAQVANAVTNGTTTADAQPPAPTPTPETVAPPTIGPVADPYPCIAPPIPGSCQVYDPSVPSRQDLFPASYVNWAVYNTGCWGGPCGASDKRYCAN